MTISEVTTTDLCLQLRENEAALSEAELNYIKTLKEWAIDDIKRWTGINGVSEADSHGRKLDDYPGLTRALFQIVTYDYDHRTGVDEKGDRDRILRAALHLADFNLIPAVYLASGEE